jgi:hypothetical protein
MTNLQELKSEAAKLPESDRQELAEFILSSLEQELIPDVHHEWVEVAQVRLAEIRSGQVAGIPAAEVMAKLPGGECDKN